MNKFKKHSVTNNCSDLSLLTVRINCSSDLKIFANSRPSALNFKSFFLSLEHFFLTVGQNNFGNKIPFLLKKTYVISSVLHFLLLSFDNWPNFTVKWWDHWNCQIISCVYIKFSMIDVEKMSKNILQYGEVVQYGWYNFSFLIKKQT